MTALAVMLTSATLTTIVVTRPASSSPGLTTRVSVDSVGAEANGRSEGRPSLSATGRFIAFTSHATNLVTGDSNGRGDVFVHDRQTGSTQRVSIASDGTQGNQNSSLPAISADGASVAFVSQSSTLVPNQPAGLALFVHDRQTGTTSRIAASAGLQPAMSADGRFVAFLSSDAALVSGDTNGTTDAFVHDRQTGTTTRASIASDGTQATDASESVALSSDGRFVAFSTAAPLTTEDTNQAGDVFVHDRQTGATTRASIGGTFARDPDISGDGRYVVFNGRNIGGPTSSNLGDIYIHDRQTGTTSRVAQGALGARISDDGQAVTFYTAAADVVPGDTNGALDVFVHDRRTGATMRESVDSSGGQANGRSETPDISADGSVVAFVSSAPNLVASDTNNLADVFVHELAGSGSVPSSTTTSSSSTSSSSTSSTSSTSSSTTSTPTSSTSTSTTSTSTPTTSSSSSTSTSTSTSSTSSTSTTSTSSSTTSSSSTTTTTRVGRGGESCRAALRRIEEQLAAARTRGDRRMITRLEAMRTTLRAQCGDDCSAPPPATGPDSVALQRETSSKASSVVTPEGGVVEAVDRAGNRYTLTVPPRALLEPTMITVTPLTRAGGLPVCGGQFLGADLGPDGLRFYEVARLEITPAGSAVASNAIAFRSNGDGRELHLHPLATDRSRLIFEVVHFSTTMVVVQTGDSGPVLQAVPPAPGDWEKEIPQAIERLNRAHRQLPVEDYGEMLQQLLEKYYEQVIEPLLPRIAGDCDFATDNLPKVLGFGRTVTLALGEESSAAMSEPILRTTKAAAENCFRTAVSPCLDRNNAEQVAKALFFGRVAQILGGDPDEFNPFDPRYACTQDAVGSVTWTRTVEDSWRYKEGKSDSLVVENLEIDAAFKRDPNGDLRNAGTHYTYNQTVEGESQHWDCHSSVEGRAYSTGAAPFASLTPTFPTPDYYQLDVGGFAATGSQHVNQCGHSRTATLSVRFPEFRDNGCSLRAPNGPFPGILEGRAQDLGGGTRIAFTCMQTKLEKTSGSGFERTRRETIRVTGLIQITVPGPPQP